MKSVWWHKRVRLPRHGQAGLPAETVLKEECASGYLPLRFENIAMVRTMPISRPCLLSAAEVHKSIILF
jgi:hypothetical protein